MESAAQAGGRGIDKDSCSCKISPERAARRGQQRHVGRQVKTPGPPPRLWHAGWYSSPPYYLIGSLQGGGPSTSDGEIKGITGCILIGFTGSDTERSNRRLKTWKHVFPSLDLQHFGKSPLLGTGFEPQNEDSRENHEVLGWKKKNLDLFLNKRKQ